MLTATISVAGGLLALFLFMGLYIGVSLGALGILLTFMFSSKPLYLFAGQIMWNPATNFIFVAVPLFVLMGELLMRGGLTDKMYFALSKWLTWLPGGLLHTNIAACALFAAVSGSSVATAATIGTVAIPAFAKRGYNERLVLGSLAAGGTLGILIPPSINMIIYGLLTETSIGRLYVAGFLPGFLLAGLFMAFIFFASLLHSPIAAKEEAVSMVARLKSLPDLIPVAILVVVVLGSIYMGYATPTEAAALGVVGSLLLAALLPLFNAPIRRVTLLVPAVLVATYVLAIIFLSGETEGGKAISLAVLFAIVTGLILVFRLKRLDTRFLTKVLHDSAFSTARTSGMIMFIVLGAFVFNFVFTTLGVPRELAKAVDNLTLPPLALFGMIIGFYLLLGTFMEALSMMVTTLGVMFPIIEALGLEQAMNIRAGEPGVFFGIIIVIMAEAAIISPPEGMNLYVIQGIRRTRGTIADVWVGVLPFFAIMIAMCGLLIAFPGIALWLPRTMKG